MHRKTDIYELDIPSDDIECWDRYPKHRWVYDLSRLLDAQNIKWSPYEMAGFERELNIDLFSLKPLIKQPGFIYIKKPEGKPVMTELYIARGEIKLMRHLNDKFQELPNLIGGVELRLSAFTALYFQKFTGVVTCETIGNDIFKIRLRPLHPILEETNQEVVKLIKRIYKKSEITINGLQADQVRQETLAS